MVPGLICRALLMRWAAQASRFATATTKTKRGRRIKLSAFTIAVLRDHLKRAWSSEFVFTSNTGHIRHSNLIRRWWNPLLKAAKIEAKAARATGDDDYGFPAGLALYALRHSSSEVAALAGVDYDLASARMGHAPTPMTTFKRYFNLSQGRESQAVEQLGNFIGGLRKHGLRHGLTTPSRKLIRPKRKALRRKAFQMAPDVGLEPTTR